MSLKSLVNKLTAEDDGACGSHHSKERSIYRARVGQGKFKQIRLMLVMQTQNSVAKFEGGQSWGQGEVENTIEGARESRLKVPACTIRDRVQGCIGFVDLISTKPLCGERDHARD